MTLVRRVLWNRVGHLRSGWRLAALLAAMAAALAAVGFGRRLLGALRPIVDGVMRPWPLLLAGGTTLAAVLLATALAMYLLEHRSLATAGLVADRRALRSTAAGLVLGALPVTLTVLAAAIGGNVTIAAQPISAASLTAVTLPILLGLALTSALEEVILRGYAMQLLAEGGGRWLAALVTGGLFGLAHASNPGANPLGLVNTAVNGVLLGWLVIRTGSLWLACGYHAGWNLAGSLGFGMTLSGIEVPGAPLATALAGPDWLTGGGYGFEGSVVAGIAELVVLVLAVALARHLPGLREVRPWFAGRPVPAAPRGDDDRVEPTPPPHRPAAADEPRPREPPVRSG